MSNRANEVMMLPGEWFWWPSRNTTAARIRRWLERLDVPGQWEVRSIQVECIEHNKKSYPVHFKVRYINE